jgi:hypothetical protein
MELRVLGLPEGPSLGIVAGPFIVVAVVLRPSLPLSVLQEAQHHVRQAQIAVHGLLHHHAVCVMIPFVAAQLTTGFPGFRCSTALFNLIDQAERRQVIYGENPLYVINWLNLLSLMSLKSFFKETQRHAHLGIQVGTQ